MSDKPKLSTEPYKGVRDFYPEAFAVQKYIFETMRTVAERAGYVEYGASILEPAELYRAKGADNEEIVNDQTYTFTDRGDREVTLRPEMTPTLVRMVAARRRELAFPLRWYSIPNVFRYERPQRGRLREHWQLNVDLFGTSSPAADIEIIAVAYGIMKAFGAKDDEFVIRVNSRAALNRLAGHLGLNDETRHKFLYLMDRKSKLGPDAFDLELDALGIDPEKITLDDMSEDVAAVVRPLNDTGFKNVVFDPGVVRGFDYYTGVVFEVFDTNPENNRSLFGGGRYDKLLALFGEEKIPAVGFGMGDVTLRDFLESRDLLPAYVSPIAVYIAVADPPLALEAERLAGELRESGINTAIDFGERKLGDQIKSADKQKIPYLIVVGEDELKSREFIIKNLETGEEKKSERENLSQIIINSQ
ncbi:MAG: histidine--tRNA ligase [Minisyncoccia bacterium]